MSKPSKIVLRPGGTVGTGKRESGKSKGASHMDRLAQLPCALCERLGMTQAGRTYVHHIREGQGKSQRASDYLAIPLCYDCHQGPEGIHGDRSLLRVAKCEELDLLADVIAKVAA